MDNSLEQISVDETVSTLRELVKVLDSKEDAEMITAGKAFLASVQAVSDAKEHEMQRVIEAFVAQVQKRQGESEENPSKEWLLQQVCACVRV
jgi:hypothetical protein